MNLENMKRVGELRTKGKWRYKFDPLQEKSRLWTTEDKYYLFNGYSTKPNPDFEFIALAANKWDKLMAVVEWAQKYTTTSEPWEVSSLDKLRAALKALEQK